MSKLTGFVMPAGDRAYFFSGDSYVRYDVAADAVDAGYPKPISGNWTGLWADGIDAVSMRNLSARLDVVPMALNRVPAWLVPKRCGAIITSL